MTVTPATLGESPSGQAAGVPYSPLYDDVYHAVAGAWAQARHVFLAGNGLPQRWQGRTRFVILETGFGLGNNFLATWAGWLRDPARCDHLIFVSVEKHPLQRDDLARAHDLADHPASAPAPMPARAGAEPVEGEAIDRNTQDLHDRYQLAHRLVQAWPPLTPGLHTLHFEQATPAAQDAASARSPQRVSLLLGLGDIADLLPALVLRADAFFLDGFAPAKNPQMWDEGLLSRLNRLAAPGATAATWTAARRVRDALAQAGFTVMRTPGFAGKRDMVQARYEPRYTPAPQAGGWWPEPAAASRHAIVLGAGLAGCMAAYQLCKAGWRVTLIDPHTGPAQEASGNPGGLFHSVLHAEDSIHARAHRAAALSTWRLARPWMESGCLAGDARGLLRLDAQMQADAAHTLLAAQQLGPDHVQWLDAAQAQARSGLAVPSGGWLFHQAGWLHPAGLAQVLLDEARLLKHDGRPLLTCLWQRKATQILTSLQGLWQVTDAQGSIAQAPSLILCNALQAPHLLSTLPADQAVAPLPLSAVRGQITALEESLCGIHLQQPTLPVAGSGYVLPLRPGALLCGATTQHHDADTSVRKADHRHNLAQAARLGAIAPLEPEAPLPAALQGRTAWRATPPDRLPLVGALPWSAERLASASQPRRLDQVRLIPRQRDQHGGLYVLTGLGSRGITWSALAGELLAHWVTGSPCPVESDLRDALDPARFLVRQMIRAKMPAPN